MCVLSIKVSIRKKSGINLQWLICYKIQSNQNQYHWLFSPMLMRDSAKWKCCISYRPELPGFMCLFVLFCVLPEVYYWLGGRFRFQYFFSIYFYVFVFSYFFALFDWYVIICWCWRIKYDSWFLFLVPKRYLVYFFIILGCNVPGNSSFFSFCYWFWLVVILFFEV